MHSGIRLGDYSKSPNILFSSVYIGLGSKDKNILDMIALCFICQCSFGSSSLLFDLKLLKHGHSAMSAGMQRYKEHSRNLGMILEV